MVMDEPLGGEVALIICLIEGTHGNDISIQNQRAIMELSRPAFVLVSRHLSLCCTKHHVVSMQQAGLFKHGFDIDKIYQTCTAHTVQSVQSGPWGPD